MKILVVLIGLFLSVNTTFAAVHTMENYESRETRELTKDYYNILAEVKNIAKEVDDKNVKSIADYILSGREINGQTPILKKVDNASDFWCAVITYYESAKLFFKKKVPKVDDNSIFDYAAIRYALEVQFTILDHYGNEEYKKNIEKTSHEIQESIIRQDDIYSPGFTEAEKVDTYFKIASKSYEEKHSKALFIWLQSVFKAIENTSVTNDEIFCEKLSFIKLCVESKIIE